MQRMLLVTFLFGLKCIFYWKTEKAFKCVQGNVWYGRLFLQCLLVPRFDFNRKSKLHSVAAKSDTTHALQLLGWHY